MVTNRQARVSLTVIFAATGVFVGSWGARIPAIQDEFNLSDARLGLTIACMTIGAIACSPLAGWASARFGSRVLLRASAPAAALAFAFIALAPDATLLALALALMGAANGLVQVSMNSQAIVLEKRYERTIMSTMHGGFSIGMMAAALVAALVAHLGVPYRVHLAVVAALLLAVGLGIGFFLIETERTPRSHRGRVRVSLPLAVILIVAFLELFCEGTAVSWSSVYMDDSIGASSALAALTFGLYSLAMTVGRFWGDRLVLGVGVGGLARAGGSTAVCGIALALAVKHPVAAMAGFALFGLGLSCLAPILFRAAGQLPLPEGQGIATLLFAAWPAFLLVAPLIGGLSDISSLRTALTVTLGAAVAMTALSGLLGRLAPAPLAPVETEQGPAAERAASERAA